MTKKYIYPLYDWKARAKDYVPSLLCKKCSKFYPWFYMEIYPTVSCDCILHPTTAYNRRQIVKKRIEAYYTDKQENWNIV